VIKLVRIALALAALLLGVTAYWVQVDDLFSPSDRALAIVAVAWAFVVAGLVAWSRRPANRLGPLMLAAGLALLLRQLRYDHDPLVFTVFFLLGDLSYALVGHSVLAYPTGRVVDRAERALVKAGYVAVLVFPLGVLLFYDASRQLLFFDPTPRESLLLVAGDADVVEFLQKSFVVVFYGVLASLFIALIVRRLIRATPRARRILAPLMVGGVAVALRALFEVVFSFVDRPFAYDYLFWWQIAAFIALPLALLAGLLQARLARAGVGDLILSLERTPPQGIRDELARSLGDPTLTVAFWLPERREFVDAAGVPVELPSDDDRRVVTRLVHEGEPLAAFVHDASLLEDPKLLEAAGAAARLALENARLHADLRAQLTRVQESRVRIVSATDEERRRIERDLHDGAQQRLVALALQLRSAQRQLESADPEVDRLLTATVGELQVAVEELRELARGVHPAILTEEGLAAALESLTSRMPLPIALDVSEGRLPPQVEATAYFVVCEALANVVKHARASQATVGARHRNGVLVIEVEDDGIGGAHPNDGSGLRGLADRVEALGGRLRVESPAGSGTRIVGEIPCGS
jgi:signal transduction histidine kinase